MKNPFSVTSPENLTASDIAKLFVDVLSDVPKILDPSHTFIHGARGTGKSMMLRFLEPEVQKTAHKISEYNQLRFFAVHVPLRNYYYIVELFRLVGDRLTIFSEHMLTTHICTKLFDSLSKLTFSQNEYKIAENLLLPDIKRYLSNCGYSISTEIPSEKNIFGFLSAIYEDIFTQSNSYLTHLTEETKNTPYTGPILGYLDHFLLLAKLIAKLKFLPNGPIYLMLDDADDLPIELQMIINNWVSCRTTDSICLKITTQLKYKTYRTTFGRVIESPHDYSEVDLTTVYSPSTSNFGKRIEKIINRRFEVFQIDSNPNEFFPIDREQEDSINLIKKEYEEKWTRGEGRGHRKSDDVVRYARPEYIRRLGGSKKSRSKYSYAGFLSIVTLANGVIRWFLEPASRMYSSCASSTDDGETVRSIPVHIQDRIIKEWSEEFLTDDFDKLKQSLEMDTSFTPEINQLRAARLLNLINGLGQLFGAILLDEDSAERRVFSFMISNPLEDDCELNDVLNLGVKWGYLLKSTIGAKEGLGRKPLFILSRRLAPYFILDVTGYVGYLSITTESLKIALTNPSRFVSERLKNKSKESLALLNFCEGNNVINDN